MASAAPAAAGQGVYCADYPSRELVGGNNLFMVLQGVYCADYPLRELVGGNNLFMVLQGVCCADFPPRGREDSRAGAATARISPRRCR